jgi:signal transduction histidine kinase
LVVHMTEASSQPAVDPPSKDSALVLLVDDDPSLRRMVKRALDKTYRVVTASDGEEGLAQAMALGPDIIVSDLLMPGLSGEELLEAVRSRPELNGVPFLLLTGQVDYTVRLRALRGGAQDYLTKPFSVEELRARVAIHLGLKLARDVLQHELDTTNTSLEQLAREVADRRRAAEEALQSRDAFIQEATHELRAPLTNVLGAAQLFVRDLNRSEQPDLGRLRNYAGIIEHQTRRLSRLVDHLLELPHLEGRGLRLSRINIDLAALVRDVAASVEAMDAEHRIEVRTPIQLYAAVDPNRIEELLAALLENAFKFSPAGGGVEMELTAPDRGSARLVVRDHGIGVPPDKRAQLFERFYQAHAGLHFAGQVGVGLGLYISRRIVEQHGGLITAEFPADGGTRVVIRLPTVGPF